MLLVDETNQHHGVPKMITAEKLNELQRQCELVLDLAYDSICDSTKSVQSDEDEKSVESYERDYKEVRSLISLAPSLLEYLVYALEVFDETCDCGVCNPCKKKEHFRLLIDSLQPRGN